MLRSTWILFSTHALRTVTSRRALLCFGLTLVPVVIALLIRFFAEATNDSPPAVAVGYLLVMPTIVPIVAVVLGSAVVAEEVEDRTITYLITRPIPRASILLGRWFASAIVITALLAFCAFTVVALLEGAGTSNANAALPDGFRMRLVGVAIAGGLVYSAVFAAVGSYFKRPVLLGLAYSFVIEFFLSIIPFASQKMTIQYYLKSVLLADEPELVARYSGFLVQMDLEAPGDAIRTLALTGVIALALGAVILSRRQVLLTA